MRWSSTLTLFAIEFLAIFLPAILALPLPEDFDLVARNPPYNWKKKERFFSNIRGAVETVRQNFKRKQQDSSKNLKETSSNYRNAARQSSLSFDFIDGVLTKFHHVGLHEPQKGQHADHVLEAQTVKSALKSIGQTFENLKPSTRHRMKKAFNSPDNVVFIPGSTNMSKGQQTKKALKGPSPEPPQRPDLKIYLPVAGPRASRFAPTLDKILKEEGVPRADESPMRKEAAKVRLHMRPTPSRSSTI